MTNSTSIIDILLKIFPTEQSCIDYFEEQRWTGKPISPFDSTSLVYRCANNRYRCKNTGKYFSVCTGTVFENSKIPLQKFFVAFYLFSAHKKGISSHQLARDISITQKSAWFLLNRLRRAFEHPNFQTMLKNVVEIDEAFIGGSNPNRHWDKKAPKTQGRNWKDKIPVLGILERNGNLIAQVVPNTKLSTLKKVIRAKVKKDSEVYTDEWYRYSNLSQSFNHQIVNHSAKQYANGKVSTNSIENRWSHLKRMIYGTYHWVSKKHTQKYLDEYTLRSNTRQYSDKERFNLVLLSSIGKRLTYQQLIN